LVEKIILFVSTGRTGTKTLANFFKDTFPEVTSYHQPAYSRVINVFSNMYLSNILPESFLKRFVYYYKFPQILSCKTRIYVEANTMNYVVAPYFKELRMDLHVFHVIRNPFDWVTSYINWIEGRAFSKIANTIIPFWHANGFLSDKYSLLEWLKMSDFEKMCWYWSYENEIILNRCKQISNFKTFKFEDLFINKNENILIDILKKLGLKYESSMMKYFEKKQNVSNKRYFPTPNYWDKHSIEILESICGDMMKRYGYISLNK